MKSAKRWSPRPILVVALAFATAGSLSSAANAARPASKTPAATSTVFVRPHSPVIGPEKAPVTIVEFFDPSCEACLAMYPIVKRIMAEYPKDVRLVVRFLPLHPGSAEAIRIIEAGRSQGVFIPVLEAVLNAQPLWHGGDMTGAWEAAKTAGLDVDKARANMKSPKVAAAIKQDETDRVQLGVRGTPTFFVNGKPLGELVPMRLYEMVRDEVAASRK